MACFRMADRYAGIILAKIRLLNGHSGPKAVCSHSAPHQSHLSPVSLDLNMEICLKSAPRWPHFADVDRLQ